MVTAVSKKGMTEGARALTVPAAGFKGSMTPLKFRWFVKTFMRLATVPTCREAQQSITSYEGRIDRPAARDSSARKRTKQALTILGAPAGSFQAVPFANNARSMV